jgi:hypothetical protein
MMGQLRRFEKRLEKIFEGPFAKAFKGGVHPLEIAHRLMKEVDDGRVLGLSETLAPNDFTIRLSPRDHQRLAGVMENLTAELESMVIDYSNRRGYHLITRPRLEFQTDASLREGEFSVSVCLDEQVKARPMAEEAGEGPRRAPGEDVLGVLAIIKGDESGRSYLLEGTKTSIGRDEENDITLADPRASRFHAEIERVPSGYIIRDLGSTNGTLVGGRQVSERLLEDGDTLIVGGTEMRFGLAGARG